MSMTMITVTATTHHHDGDRGHKVTVTKMTMASTDEHYLFSDHINDGHSNYYNKHYRPHLCDGSDYDDDDDDSDNDDDDDDKDHNHHHHHHHHTVRMTILMTPFVAINKKSNVKGNF